MTSGESATETPMVIGDRRSAVGGRPSSPTATHIVVRAAASIAVARSPSPLRATSSRSISRRLPTSTRQPSTTAIIPCPATASNCSGDDRVNPRISAARTIACPSGCSLPRSALAARRSASNSDMTADGRPPTAARSDVVLRSAVGRRPSAVAATFVMTSVTAGSPRVIVPVLSSTIASSRWACSSAALFLNRMPASAPLPTPTMIDVGVASPMAHGQAMTSTAMSRSSAGTKPAPANSQTAKVSTARMMTAGTNHAATRSTTRWMGALLPWALSTMRMIWARALSLPTRWASMVSNPWRLSVAPMTPSPVALSTGKLSPVIMLSSTDERPSTTRPSTGIFSPGRTRSTSPGTTSATGTSISTPPRTTRAVFGCSPMSFLIASLVRPLARASSSLPATMRVMMTAEVSK